MLVMNRERFVARRSSVVDRGRDVTWISTLPRPADSSCAIHVRERPPNASTSACVRIVRRRGQFMRADRTRGVTRSYGRPKQPPPAIATFFRPSLAGRQRAW
jgi:hypothetical protein